jgi:hypothetical protein
VELTESTNGHCEPERILSLHQLPKLINSFEESTEGSAPIIFFLVLLSIESVGFSVYTTLHLDI